MEDALVGYRHARVVLQFPFLQLHQAATDLHDVVPRPFVHLWVSVSDIVEDVQGKRPIPSSNLVNDEVFVREILEEVFGHNALCNTLPVPWLHARYQNGCHRLSKPRRTLNISAGVCHNCFPGPGSSFPYETYRFATSSWNSTESRSVPKSICFGEVTMVARFEK